MYPEDSETDSGEEISEPSARRLAVRDLERRIDQLTETAMESSHSQVTYSLALLSLVEIHQDSAFNAMVGS